MIYEFIKWFFGIKEEYKISSRFNMRFQMKLDNQYMPNFIED